MGCGVRALRRWAVVINEEKVQSSSPPNCAGDESRERTRRSLIEWGMREVENGRLNRRDFLIWATSSGLTSLPARQSLLGALFGIGDSAIRKTRDRVDAVLDQELRSFQIVDGPFSGWVTHSAGEIFADLHAEIVTWSSKPDTDAEAIRRLRELTLAGEGYQNSRGPARSSTERSARSRKIAELKRKFAERQAVAAHHALTSTLADPPLPLLMPYFPVGSNAVKARDPEELLQAAQSAHDKGSGVFLPLISEAVTSLTEAPCAVETEAQIYQLLTLYLMGFEHISALRTARRVRELLQTINARREMSCDQRLRMMIRALVHPAIVLRAHGYAEVALAYLRQADAILAAHGPRILPSSEVADLRVDILLHLAGNSLLDRRDPRIGDRVTCARNSWLAAARTAEKFELSSRQILIHRRRLELETASAATWGVPNIRTRSFLHKVSASISEPSREQCGSVPWRLTWLLAQASAAVARQDAADFTKWGESFVVLMSGNPWYDNQRRAWNEIHLEAVRKWRDDFANLALARDLLVTTHPMASPFLEGGLPHATWLPTVPSIRCYMNLSCS